MPGVISENGVTWSCIQAFAGLGNNPDKADAARSAAAGSGLRVFCTPSGGARSVALELPEAWEKDPSDAQLLSEILEGSADVAAERYHARTLSGAAALCRVRARLHPAAVRLPSVPAPER